MRPWKAGAAALLLAGVGLVLAGTPARTADHRDAPNVLTDPAIDINDVYAFVNPNNQKVVLAMTVNPFTVPGLEPRFAQHALYQFKIDNDNDFRPDLEIQATFSKPGTDQALTLRGPSPPRGDGSNIENPLRTSPTATGPANGTIISGQNGIRAFAGLRDDPFFFDFIFVGRLIGFVPGGPVSRDPGIDFFAGMNVDVLAVEVPASLLKSRNSNTIHVWGTTSRTRRTRRFILVEDKVNLPYVQVERMGLPVINTVLINGSHKDAFNKAIPSRDQRDYLQDAVEHLVAINHDQAYSTQLARQLLPDVLTLDVTSAAGFLNGRRPQDDVIDGVLNLASKGAVTSDAVNGNDKQFLSDFPFFAAPHDPDEPIPPRN